MASHIMRQVHKHISKRVIRVRRHNQKRTFMHADALSWVLHAQSPTAFLKYTSTQPKTFI